MVKNNLITIQCHCNNKEKIFLLEENIKKLKKEKFKILVVSHIPVSQKIQNKVDYFIYDKSNPILHWPERAMAYFKIIKGSQNYKVVNFLYDYGWTTINQILLSGNLGLSLEFDYFTFINYDIELTDNIIKQMKKPQPCLTSEVIDNTIAEKKRWPSFILNILDRTHLEKILKILSKEKYIAGYTKDNKKHYKYGSSEEYWGHVLTNFNYNVFPEVINETMVVEKPSDLFNYSKHKEFKIIIKNNTTHKLITPYSKEGKAIIYNNKSKIDFIINDKTVEINQEKVLIELPNIKKIGYMYNGEYVDLLDDYKKSNYVNIYPIN